MKLRYHPDRPLVVADALSAVAETTGVATRALQSPSRGSMRISWARQVAYVVLYRLGLSWPEVATALGRETHSAALLGARAAEEDPAAMRAVERVMEAIAAGHNSTCRVSLDDAQAEALGRLSEITRMPVSEHIYQALGAYLAHHKRILASGIAPERDSPYESVRG